MKERVSKARNEGMFTPPGLTDTIAMPGNQGGSNWGTTAGDPQKGMVFVVGVNQVAILKLEDVTKRTLEPGRGGGGGNAALQAGFAVYQQYCTGCHGANLLGASRLPTLAASPIAGGRAITRSLPASGAMRRFRASQSQS